MQHEPWCRQCRAAVRVLLHLHSVAMALGQLYNLDLSPCMTVMLLALRQPLSIKYSYSVIW